MIIDLVWDWLSLPDGVDPWNLHHLDLLLWRREWSDTRSEREYCLYHTGMPDDGPGDSYRIGSILWVFGNLFLTHTEQYTRTWLVSSSLQYPSVHLSLCLSLTLSSNSPSPPVYSFFHQSNCPSFLFLIFYFSLFYGISFILCYFYSNLIWLSLSRPPLFPPGYSFIYFFIIVLLDFFHLSNLTILFFFFSFLYPLIYFKWFFSLSFFLFSPK